MPGRPSDLPLVTQRASIVSAPRHRFALSAGQRAFPAQQDLSGPATPLEYLPALKGDYFKHESKNVGRPFHIYVAFPESYAAQPLTRYPTVYLLDGDSTFPILAASSGSPTSLNERTHHDQ